MEFREILQQTRKARGWSQEDLAEKIQVSRQAVSKWETGDAMPDLLKLLALADALNISLDALCGRTGQTSGTTNNCAQPEKAAEKSPLLSSKKQLPLWVFALVCIVFIALGAQLGPQFTQNTMPAPAPLPEEVTVSALRFNGRRTQLAYEFIPSVVGADYTYQLVFTNYRGKDTVFDILCENGGCTGSVYLPPEGRPYSARLLVSNGKESRVAAMATDITFGDTYSSWAPAE